MLPPLPPPPMVFCPAVGAPEEIFTTHELGHLNHRKFDRNLELFREYVEKTGTAPKYKTIHRGVKIGVWQGTQRKKYWQKKLSLDRIKALENSKCWTWKGNFNKVYKLELMKEYVNTFGKLPTSYDVYKGFPLGKWQDEQRKKFSEKNLSPLLIKRLETIPQWRWKAAQRVKRRSNKQMHTETASRRCSLCHYHDSSANHYCSHVAHFMHFKMFPPLPPMDKKHLLKNQIKEYIFQTYWDNVIATHADPPPRPQFECLRDSVLSFCKDMSPYRSLLHDKQLVEKELEKIASESKRTRLQEAHKYFNHLYALAYEYICTKLPNPWPSSNVGPGIK